MNELTIDGKTYISSKRAAEITGYARDYVGQLCREGHVQARLVGRSWYVLEDSIREHRFGKEEVGEDEDDNKQEVWVAPKYVAEDAPEMPELKERQPVVRENKEEKPALSDMQEAWQEWFATKKDVVETVEVNTDEEEEIEIERIPSAAPSAPRVMNDIQPLSEEKTNINTPWSDLQDVVPLHRSHTSMPLSEPVENVEPVVMPSKRRGKLKKEKASSAANALLLALAGLAIVITLIGTGQFSSYLGENLASNPIFQYLGGKSTLEK